jgi:hypothetical protein
METLLNQSEHSGKLIVLGLHHPDSLRRLHMGLGPSEISPHLHNKKDKFALKWIIIPSSVISLI